MKDIEYMKVQIDEHFKFRKMLTKLTLRANIITFLIVVVIIGIDVLKYICR